MNDDIETIREGLQVNAHEAAQAVARLEALLESFGRGEGAAFWHDKYEELEVEVERLHGELGVVALRAMAAESEGETLRDQLDGARTAANIGVKREEQRRIENKRLRADNENLSTANDTYRYEAERLRAEIARYKADPTLLLAVDESKVIYFPEEKA
jgi:hypothetical protein